MSASALSSAGSGVESLLRPYFPGHLVRALMSHAGRNQDHLRRDARDGRSGPAARITGAAARSRSAETDGPIRSGCPTSSPGSPAKRAAGAARMFARISIGIGSRSRRWAVGSRQKFSCSITLHCPAFLRLSIVCRHPEVQAFPAANCGPRFWHALVQALTSQLTAAARADGADDSG